VPVTSGADPIESALSERSERDSDRTFTGVRDRLDLQPLTDFGSRSSTLPMDNSSSTLRWICAHPICHAGPRISGGHVNSVPPCCCDGKLGAIPICGTPVADLETKVFVRIDARLGRTPGGRHWERYHSRGRQELIFRSILKELSSRDGYSDLPILGYLCAND
jgi:hypothetical protein